ncbi:uncharacterized protein BX664DRAFT_342896 [Halteromyces radiatus]|uniref:uncharacterized protein n=1 Tax=Halteromyces radiatus TaxID=101107 RepID=UPI00221EB0B2|nr:uncharacterized protein BX664DRAFT_342896 [Halteromyces radiatus]KAI8078856.1 hypothetical protein BX664DRAFT_342896 [Halteromyces radiatus]
MMKSTSVLAVFLFFPSLIYCQLASGNNTGNCTPSNCQAVCNPPCSTDMSCVLGTMKSCGVCPSSSCISNSILGLPTSGNSTNNNGGQQQQQQDSNGPDGAMIGGIVGGLVGGGLLLAAALCWLFRHQKQKKRGLPFIVPGNNRLDTTSSVVMSTTTTRSPSRMTTGLSPTPVIPTSLASLSSAQRHQLHIDQHINNNNNNNHSNNNNNNGNQLRPISSSSYLDDDDDHSSLSSLSQRGSVAMTATIGKIQHQPALKSGQAFQATRMKAHVMRVNRLVEDNRSSNGTLSRSGSVRTILTRDNSIHSLSRSNTAPSRPQKNNSNNSTSTTLESLKTKDDSSTKRISAPMLVASNNDPFDDRHSVIEDDIGEMSITPAK